MGHILDAVRIDALDHPDEVVSSEGVGEGVANVRVSEQDCDLA